MTSSDRLQKALGAIDSNSLIAEFLTNSIAIDTLGAGCERLALWTNELHRAEHLNPASPFLFEMQRSSHDVAILLALGLYIPAAAAMRTMLETAIYYSYFRSHPTELSTLATVPDYYISKKSILEFHKLHSEYYRLGAEKFGLPGDLNSWYSKVSAIVHGQLPGSWGTRLALKDTRHDASVLKIALETFDKGIDIIHSFLLLTIGAEVWGSFHHEAKKALLKGMSADKRALLHLDGN